MVEGWRVKSRVAESAQRNTGNLDEFEGADGA
jgi:hypothetical protein